MINLCDLTGKVAVVAGASSGLGADAARAYAEAGAKVAMLARRTDKLEAVAKEIAGKGGDVFTYPCDVTNEQSVKEAVDAIVKHYGTIHILFNNAGIAQRGTVETLTVEEWDRSMDTNVKGIYLMSKYVVPHMKAQNYGKIVNTASINAIIGDKGDMFVRHVYNTSKAAVLGLTMGMATSYGQNNITVNAVGPGLFESEMTEGTLFKSSEFLAQYSRVCPLNRPAKRGELNGTILYFSSDMSSYVTGQFVVVAGGTELV